MGSCQVEISVNVSALMLLRPTIRARRLLRTSMSEGEEHDSMTVRIDLGGCIISYAWVALFFPIFTDI